METDRVMEAEGPSDVETVKVLQNRIEQLESKLHHLACDRFGKKSSTDPGCHIQVLFMNTGSSRKFRHDIESYIESLLDKEKEEAVPVITTQPHHPDMCGIVDPNSTASAVDRVVGSSQIYRYFSLDFLGWQLVDSTPACTPGWEIPFFERIVEGYLPCDECDKPEKETKKRGAECFNCGGSHSLNECKEERNQKKISINIAKHKQANKKIFTKRYHVDGFEGVDPKPGVISPALREALGLGRDELPLHIYKMRMAGYPPGWWDSLRHGEGGSMAVYDRDGIEVNLDGDLMEDGEVPSLERKDGSAPFDPENIVQYPGFTAPLLPNTEDMYRRHHAPPADHEGTIKRLLIDMSHARPAEEAARNAEDAAQRQDQAQRKRVRSSNDDRHGVKRLKGGSELETVDMVLDNSEEEGECSPEIKAPGTDTPMSPDKGVIESPASPDAAGDTGKAGEEIEGNTSLVLPSSTPVTVSTPANKSSSSFISMGTPVIPAPMGDDGQPISRIAPDPAKFGEGMEQALPFENLEGSVGTFKKIVVVLDKVRKFLPKKKKK